MSMWPYGSLNWVETNLHWSWFMLCLYYVSCTTGFCLKCPFQLFACLNACMRDFNDPIYEIENIEHLSDKRNVGQLRLKLVWTREMSGKILRI